MKLNVLKDNEGAVKTRKRVGRGVGSGLGKTAGRGYKGQKSRSGVAIKSFEGGQMPVHRRLPKRGFTNIFRKNYAEINLDRIQDALNSGKLNSKVPITEAVLVEAGVVRRLKDGIRILGRGVLTTQVEFVVSSASRPAVEAIEKSGSKITLTVAQEQVSE